jgi:lysozyme family protein
VLEYAVLAGPTTSAKMLQRALIELGYSQTVEIDGKIGPKTLSAIRDANQKQLSEELFDQMRVHLEEIILSKPKLRKFRTGWFRRIRATREQVSLCLS